LCLSRRESRPSARLRGESNLAIDPKPVDSIEAGGLKDLCESAGLAKDDVTRPAPVAVWIGSVGADEQIVETIAIDIARACDCRPQSVVSCLTPDFKSGRTVEAGELEIRC